MAIDHEHRYFIFEVKAAFEQWLSPNGEIVGSDGTLYERVEYAIMGCNCGDVIKRKVKEVTDDKTN